ncbi:hypothetical protein K2Y11_09585 [bacterium]|nr:hypothetical protein [bacterium]
MQPQQQSTFSEKMNAIEAVFNLVIGAGAVSGEVFLHRRFGKRYLGTQAFAVFLVVPIFAMFFPQDNPELLMSFLPVYLGMVILARLGIWWRHRKRDIEHSYYNGWPIFLRSSAIRNEYFCKQVLEPGLILAIAVWIAEWNRLFACYLLFVTFCLVFNNLRMRDQEQKRVMDVDDAIIQQQQLAERLRGLRGV